MLFLVARNVKHFHLRAPVLRRVGPALAVWFDMRERRIPSKAQLEAWADRMEKLRVGINRPPYEISKDERTALQREAAELRHIADTFFDEVKAIQARRRIDGVFRLEVSRVFHREVSHH